jgi:phage terminase Nu1 subunit (DNA packaging protein)
MHVSVPEAGKIFGVSRNQILNWIKDGCPVVEKGERGKQGYVLDTREMTQWREKRAVNNATASMDSMTKEEAQRRKISAEAELAELEIAKKRGDVVLLTEMQSALENEYAEVRSTLRKIPERCVLRVIGMTDEGDIKAIILEEVDNALKLLSDE